MVINEEYVQKLVQDTYLHLSGTSVKICTEGFTKHEGVLISVLSTKLISPPSKMDDLQIFFPSIELRELLDRVSQTVTYAI